MADQLLGGIVINEILADPNGAINFDTDGNGSAQGTDEYIELYNSSASAIDISGVQLWDAGVGNWFTFPANTFLEPGGHALVMTRVQNGGSLPTGGPDDLFFERGSGGPLINNGGDNVVVYAPSSDEYISATFNGDSLDDPTLGTGGYSGFSATATQSGAGEEFGSDTDGLSLQRSPDGGDTFISDTPTPGVSNVCFVSGTVFDTPDGPKKVENLSPGDVVTTFDHGPQTVSWVFAQSWSATALEDAPKLRPIVIAQGALGNGLPHRDLSLSQQHRVLVRSVIAQRMFGESEVLIPAKCLSLLPGVTCETPAKGVTYFHVMLEHHEVLVAEGLPSESLYLGEETLQAISPEALRELEALKGQSARQMMRAVPPKARRFIQGKRAEKLVFRHAKNDKPLVAKTKLPNRQSLKVVYDQDRKRTG